MSSPESQNPITTLIMTPNASITYTPTNASTTLHMYTAPEMYSLAHCIIFSILLSLLFIVAVVGNSFVFISIRLEPKLQNVSNYLISSLAVADLLVSVLVMPVAIVSTVTKYWFMGKIVCNVFNTLDIFTCTASILHLVLISFDRFWAVTDVSYIQTRSHKRIFFMIGFAWSVSFIISIAPQIGWHDTELDPDISGVCFITRDLGFTVFSTVGAFYLPCFVMLVVYGRIAGVARARIQKKTLRRQAGDASTAGDWSDETDAKQKKHLLPTQIRKLMPPKQRRHLTTSTARTTTVESPCVVSFVKPAPSNVEARPRSDSPSIQMTGHFPHIIVDPCAPLTAFLNPSRDSLNKFQQKEIDRENRALAEKRRRRRVQQKRERKASRTLAIITGSFILCWLPFFTMALLVPFCGDACQNANIDILMAVFTWLGYLNSGLNPIIYTVFNEDFRKAFRKILIGHYKERKYRPSSKRMINDKQKKRTVQGLNGTA